MYRHYGKWYPSHLNAHARIQEFFSGGSRPDSQKTVWTMFFCLFFLVHLILQFTEGVQWFITEKTILFQGSREGPTFSGGGGVQLFSSGVQMLISIETHIISGFPRSGKSQGKMKKKKKKSRSGNFDFSQGNLKFWQKSGNFRIRSREWRNQAIRR